MEAVPLDLSMKTAKYIPATSYNRALLPVHTCPFCTYRTLYPEVLVIHQKLSHKKNYDLLHKNTSRRKNPRLVLKMRRTGCPPALQGVTTSQQLAAVKGSPLTNPKTRSHGKPKQAPVQSRKATKSETDKYIEQEHKTHSVLQVSSSRNLQPNLQAITHMIERIQDPQQNPPLWTSSPEPQTTGGSMTSSGHTYHGIPSLSAEYAYHGKPLLSAEYAYHGIPSLSAEYTYHGIPLLSAEYAYHGIPSLSAEYAYHGIPSLSAEYAYHGIPSLSAEYAYHGIPSLSAEYAYHGIPSLSAEYAYHGIPSLSAEYTYHGIPSLSAEYTYLGIPSLSAEHPFTRPTHLEHGESFTKRSKHEKSVSASSIIYATADEIKRLHPREVNMHNLEGPPVRSGATGLPNVPYPYEVNPQWSVLKSYKQPLAGAPFAVGKPSLSQGSAASMEATPKSSAQQTPKRRVRGPTKKSN